MAGQMWAIKGVVGRERQSAAPVEGAGSVPVPLGVLGGPPSRAGDTGSRSQGLRSTTSQLWLCSAEMHIRPTKPNNPTYVPTCECLGEVNTLLRRSSLSCLLWTKTARL